MYLSVESPHGDGDGDKLAPASVNGDGNGEMGKFSTCGEGMGSQSLAGISPLSSLDLTLESQHSAIDSSFDNYLERFGYTFKKLFSVFKSQKSQEHDKIVKNHWSHI